MLKTQVSCWEQMNEMLQENYKVSVGATQQMQQTCAHIFTEAINNSARNTREMQENFKSLTAQNFQNTLEAMKTYSELFVEMSRTGVGTLRSLFEKYSVDNTGLIGEVEQFWQKNAAEQQKHFETIAQTFMKEQEKHLQIQLKTYDEYARELVNSLSKKLEEEGTIKEDKRKK